MIFEQIPTSGDRTFSYLIGDEASKEGALIDPGYDAEKLLEHVKRAGLKLKYVINTHSHYDHTGANEPVLRATGAELAAFGRGDVPLRDGSVLRLGELELKILHTPGHTPDSICILAGDVLVTGDTLFVGKVGGTDYGEGARAQYESLHKKILTLPPETRIFPGHDVGLSPSSTVGREKENNPFLRRRSFEDFVELKRNWLAYKREHGIP